MDVEPIFSPDTPKHIKIIPLSQQDVRSNITAILDESENIQRTWDKERTRGWTINRGSPELLGFPDTESYRLYEYAQLPPFNKETPYEIVQSLPSGSTLVDIPCGTGQLGSDIKYGRNEEESQPFAQINRSIITGGIDLIQHNDIYRETRPGPERLDWFITANIFSDLPLAVRETNPNFEGADVVVSSASLYHLKYPWLALRSMTELLKPQGKILASCYQRIWTPSYGLIDDNKGQLNNVEQWLPEYSKSRTSLVCLDVNGNALTSSEVVDSCNTFNTLRYEFELTPLNLPRHNEFAGLSGMRLSEEKPDFSFMFFGNVHIENSLQEIMIVAKNRNEAKSLQETGFTSIEDAYALLS